MTRLLIKFAYLGYGFSGSQVQPCARTVEGDMRSDLSTICDYSDLRLASRTDKGVNALGNAVAFNTGFSDPAELIDGLNSISTDLFYRSWAVVPDDFNPRKADIRTYRYVLKDEGMDIEKLKECSRLFIGEHDFVRFCKDDDKPTVATLDSIGISKDGNIINIDFSARFYLWNMIRRIVAAMTAVASGNVPIGDVRDALNGKEISFGLARPDGLTLTDVVYEGIEFTPASKDPRPSERIFDLELLNMFYGSL